MTAHAFEHHRRSPGQAAKLAGHTSAPGELATAPGCVTGKPLGGPPMSDDATASAPPRRVQLRRTKGWRKPDNTVVVARPSRWGNPWTIEMYRIDYGDASESTLRRMAVSDFRGMLDGRWDVDEGWKPYPRESLHELRGKNLACWCPEGTPCHADVLLELANRPLEVEAR